MPDYLPPNSTPWPSPDDLANTIADTLQNETWASLWPRTILRYATTAARDADLAGLGSANRAFALVDAQQDITMWNGTMWVSATRDTFRYGDVAACIGTNPPTTATKIRQEFTKIVTTTAGAAWALNFPTAFPNGITHLSVTVGDSNGAGGIGFVSPRLSTSSLSVLGGWAFTTAGVGATSATIRVNVVAVGW